MIQVNLLPDVKLEYLKAQRNKNLVLGIATIATIGLIALTVLLALHVFINQAIHTSGLQDDIDQLTVEYQSIDDLDEIITVGNQLDVLPGLHSDKPDATRLPELLVIIVPKDVELSEMLANFEQTTLKFDGQGKDTKTVNTFADILKNTFFSIGDGGTPLRAFSEVSFDIGVSSEDGVVFEADMLFDPAIFDAENKVDFTIPEITSTQSNLRTDDTQLFDTPTVEEE